MTYGIAKKNLKEWFDNDGIGEIEAADFILALNALEKQIPKKVITETEDDREFIDYLCPSCRVTLQQKYKQSKISTIYKYKHCPDCGQALDWSDTK